MSSELSHAPLLKLERAEHHINDLKRQVNAFLAECPFRLKADMGGNLGRFRLWIEQRKPIPPEFSLIIGDAAHNMRAALDLTLFQIASDRASKPDRIQFPFVKDDTDAVFEEACKRRQVEFAGTKVVEAIRLLKPYPGGNPELTGIHDLDVRDKHRLLILAPFIPTFTTGTKEWEYIKRFLGNIEFPAGIPVRFTRPENELFSVPLGGENIPYFEGEPPIQPSFVISFGQGQPFAHCPVLQVMSQAHSEVRRAVGAMIAAFAHPDNAFPPREPSP